MLYTTVMAWLVFFFFSSAMTFELHSIRAICTVYTYTQERGWGRTGIYSNYIHVFGGGARHLKGICFMAMVGVQSE